MISRSGQERESHVSGGELAVETDCHSGHVARALPSFTGTADKIPWKTFVSWFYAFPRLNIYIWAATTWATPSHQSSHQAAEPRIGQNQQSIRTEWTELSISQWTVKAKQQDPGSAPPVVEGGVNPRACLLKILPWSHSPPDTSLASQIGCMKFFQTAFFLRRELLLIL